MVKCSPQDIIKGVSGIQAVRLPDDWYNDLPLDKSVFSSLYDWMLGPGGVPADPNHNLHNRTYVGEKLFDKLITAEKKRLRKALKLKGDDLDDAVAWSDMNSGPKTEVSRHKISGDLILVVPESCRPEFNEFSTRFSRKKREAAIEKIRSHAAGATFYQWLNSQGERPDRVGDLARELVHLQKFPRDSNDFMAIRDTLDGRQIDSPIIGSFKQGWLEYLQQYPDRVAPAAWCGECGQRINIEDACLAWDLETADGYLLDHKCLAGYRSFSKMQSRPLEGITTCDLEQMVQKGELSAYDVEKIEENLRLWGVLPVVAEKGWVYFLRSERTHAIKIGYTAGRVEDRMVSLQTAHPYKLEVLGVSRGNREYEKSLHKRFEKFRLEGEWFDPHPDLLAFISVLPAR